jgi:hypothetical protein
MSIIVVPNKDAAVAVQNSAAEDIFVQVFEDTAYAYILFFRFLAGRQI